MIEKYRPQNLDEIIGNKVLIKSLKQCITDKTIPHRILLEGNVGCGKTTIARILAKELECHLANYHEVNCAEDGGKEKVLKLVESMRYQPMGGKSSVYVLDEAQNLSKASQQLLLKPVEKSTSYNYFIFCSTNIKKIDNALLCRLTQYPVKKINDKEMMSLLGVIYDKEKYDQPKEKLLKAVARRAEGIPRKAIKILEALRGVQLEEAQEIIDGYVLENDDAVNIARLLCKKPRVSTIVNDVLKEYKKLSQKHTDEGIRIATCKYLKAVLLKNFNNETIVSWLNCFLSPVNGPVSDVEFVLQLQEALQIYQNLRD